MRSYYLTLRYENNYIAKSYSPHRFSRQFGFHQDVPVEVNLFFVYKFAEPSKSSEILKRQEKQISKRKANITSPHDKGVKAARDSYRKGNLKIRLTRGSSTCSPKKPTMQSTKGDRSRSPSELFKDGKSSKDKDRTVLQDIFDGTDSCKLIDVMDDPVTIYTATRIIEETSDIVHDVPSNSVGTPSLAHEA
ncbi:UDP-N-acetylglucosamine 1-carboxyvinyltransferase [Bienertia sinuspersici]